jgi:hypothetical protein
MVAATTAIRIKEKAKHNNSPLLTKVLISVLTVAVLLCHYLLK